MRSFFLCFKRQDSGFLHPWNVLFFHMGFDILPHLHYNGDHSRSRGQHAVDPDVRTIHLDEFMQRVGLAFVLPQEKRRNRVEHA